MAPFIKHYVLFTVRFLSHDPMSCDPFAAILLLRLFVWLPLEEYIVWIYPYIQNITRILVYAFLTLRNFPIILKCILFSTLDRSLCE